MPTGIVDCETGTLTVPSLAVVVDWFLICVLDLTGKMGVLLEGLAVLGW